MFDKDQQKLAFLLEDITGIAPDFGNSNYGDRGRFSYSATDNDDVEIKKIDQQIEQRARRLLLSIVNFIKNSYKDVDHNVKGADTSGIELQIDNIKDKYGINMVKSMKQLLDNDSTSGYVPEYMTIYKILGDYLSKNEDNETRLPSFDELRSSYLNNPGKLALDRHKNKLKISPKRGEAALQRKKAIDMLNSYFVKELKTGAESMEFTKEIQDEKEKGNLAFIHQQLNFIKNSPAKYNNQQRRGASQLIDRIRWFM